MGDHIFSGGRVAGIRVGGICAVVVQVGSPVGVVGIRAFIQSTTPFSTDARRTDYREGLVGAPLELVVLRVYGYRYDALVGVVSYALGERLSQRLPSVRDYSSVLLQRDVRVVPVPDAERHATIAHGYAQLSALPRKLAVFGLYDDLVYPCNPGAVWKYVDNVSGNKDIFAEGGAPLQGTFLLIL